MYNNLMKGMNTMPVNSFDSYPLTWKPEKEKLKPPYYKSLAEDLEGKIRSGLLQAGTKLPPQREIADYLDKKCAEIDKLIAIKQQKIETLTEYKKSLIYEYVTGKKQVI